MSPQLGIISLKCPNCGAGISVTPELDVFACGYCGAQQMVQRGSGTVSLKLLGEAIARVQYGTDRTAAELAIRRLREELASVEFERSKIETGISGGYVAIGVNVIAAAVSLVIAGMLFSRREPIPALIFSAFAVFTSVRAAKNVKELRLLRYYLTNRLSARATNISQQLEQHLATVAD